jgi:hypothetical protein
MYRGVAISMKILKLIGVSFFLSLICSMINSTSYNLYKQKLFRLVTNFRNPKVLKPKILRIRYCKIYILNTGSSSSKGANTASYREGGTPKTCYFLCKTDRQTDR